MDWFVKQGDEIDQDMPLTLEYFSTRRVSSGPFGHYSTDLFSFAPSSEAQPPLYSNNAMKKLVVLEADLSRIARSTIPIDKGMDGQDYYVLTFQIKVKFFSAHTQYSLWYNGVEYGNVKAEYA
nr:hypothetical protein LTR18_006030 [Exophiala xenobiotica]